MKIKIHFLILIFFILLFINAKDKIDLPYEYSMEEFQKGVRAFHNTGYELAITHFKKSLGYKDDNNQARYYLGESYRKAGYEENALYVWNNLLALGYENKGLKERVASMYNKRGMLTDIYIDKDYVLREDIKGFYDDKTTPLFIKPSQIAIDKNNNYYIASYLTGTVVVLDPNLKLLRNYVSTIPKIENPFGVAVDNDGIIYVSDFKNDVVLKINKLNIVEKKIGFKGIGEGALLGPKNIILDDDENLYVSDTGNTRINKYKKTSEILFSFGTEKDGDGDLKSPCGIYYFDGKIYVCDRDTNRIVIFDKSGNYLSSFGEDKLDKPQDITRDKLGRFLIICKDKLWAFEESNDLWYLIDAPGQRLQRGTSIVTDKENNILITDFDSSRLLLLSLERQRYSNLNVNIERVLSQKFPDVHLLVTIEKDDGTSPAGINPTNLVVFENGKMVPLIGMAYTETKNNNSDILIIYDKSKSMAKYSSDLKTTFDKWLKSASSTTKVCVVSAGKDEPIIENDFNSSRLQILDTFDSKNNSTITDKGGALKFGIYHTLNRFSKKSVIIVTDGAETGKDFEKFKLDECINVAKNNDIPIYIVSFADGALSETYKYIAKKTGGDYYRVYRHSDLHDLFKRIETSKGNELVISYKSRSVSRFGDEPINLYIEANFGGMKGVTQGLYYPGRK